MLVTESRQQFVNRSRIDILASLITHSINKTRKTKLILACNLSFPQCKIYLDFLVDRGFLIKNMIEENGRELETYQATSRGIDFVNHYKRLNEIIEKL